MGIKMVQASSTNQGNSVKTVMSNRSTAYSQVIKALEQFMDSDDLKGAAYSSAKSYASNVLVPLLQGAQLLSESLTTSANNFPTKYDLGEDLDEEVLEKEIQNYEKSIALSESLMNNALKLSIPNASLVSTYQHLMEVATKNKTKAEEKLKKLRDYDTNSPSFVTIKELSDAVSAGIAQVSTDYASFNGGFPDASKRDMPWVGTVNEHYKNKLYNQILKKVSKGWVLSLLEISILAEEALRYLDRDIPEELLQYINKFYPDQARYWVGQGKTLYDGVALIYAASKISEQGKGGNLYINHSDTAIMKKLDKLFATEQYYNLSNRGKRTRLTIGKGRRIDSNGYDLIDDLHLNRAGQLKTGKTTALDFRKTLINGVSSSTKDALKSSATSGLSDIFSYSKNDGITLSKSFKAGGALGKSVAVVNVATGAIDIANGYNDTKKKALELGIKEGSSEYIQAQAGGVTIDTAKNVGVGVAATAAATTAAASAGVLVGAVSAPVWLPAAVGVGIGTVVTLGLNKIDESLGVSSKLKEAWLHFVKN